MGHMIPATMQLLTAKVLFISYVSAADFLYWGL